MNKAPQDYLALALDNVHSRQQIRELIDAVGPSFGVFKVGLEQFTRFGPSVLDDIKSAERKIFLDLKFHDIPNTVAKAVSSACELGVEYLTLHTQGGVEMLHAAAEAAHNAVASGQTAPRLLGVTLLTSIGADTLHNELGVAAEPAQYVQRLALLAAKSGIDGIVCSAVDLPQVKPILPAGFDIITPGIRPVGASVQDQKRVATPASAIEHGATLLVVGRPVTMAAEPSEAAAYILQEVVSALNRSSRASA